MIGDYNQGGIRLPDFESIMEANRVMWALKLINSTTNSYWKSMAKTILSPLGGTDVLSENFDCSYLDRLNSIPTFYKEILKAWSKISKTGIENEVDIFSQSIWHNTHFKLELCYINLQNFVNRGILQVKDVWDKNFGFNWDAMKSKGWRENEYLVWRGIIDALPVHWKTKLKEVVLIKYWISQVEINLSSYLVSSSHYLKLKPRWYTLK